MFTQFACHQAAKFPLLSRAVVKNLRSDDKELLPPCTQAYLPLLVIAYAYLATASQNRL